MAIIPADEKVFMVDKRTNTIYGGSQALQDMQQWYTMQDVSDSIQPYKVFTALLTQSGGDAEDQIDNGGHVTKGVTYTIYNAVDADFSNVGAPNSNDGTSFIAINDEEPVSFGTAGAALVFNTGAPVVTVLENTIGNVWFTYNGVGYYNINSNGLFTNNKTFITNVSIPLDDQNQKFLSIFGNVNEVLLFTIDGVVAADGVLYQPSAFEIRVYN